jgi:hypothetical protein
MKFIKLFDKDDGSELFLNPKLVESFHESEYGNFREIWTHGRAGERYTVSDSLEEIKKN